MTKSVSVGEEKHAPDRLLTPRRSRTLAILVALVVGLVVCYFLAVPFLPALTWALVLTVMFRPLHRRIEKRLRYPEAAAAATVAIAAFVVAVPLTFMAERLVNEAAKGAQIVEEAVRSGTWRDALANYPRLAPVVVWIETQLDLAGIAGSATSWLTNFSASFVRGSVAQIVDAILTFYFLFYFLRDGQQALGALKEYSPLSSQEMNRLFTRVNETVQAVVFGTVAVAAVQGAMGGLMFWLLGLRRLWSGVSPWACSPSCRCSAPLSSGFRPRCRWPWGASGERRSYSSPGVPEWLRPSTIFSTPFSWETA